MNPVREIGEVVREQGRAFIVDAMSSFAGIPMGVGNWGIDFLVSSANKCIQGVPGFGFVLARRELLLEADGRARSVSLDLVSQWKGLEGDGQFRFTPPTHVLLAFWQALEELDREGGIAARAARYAANHKVLVEGMFVVRMSRKSGGSIPAGRQRNPTSKRYTATFSRYSWLALKRTRTSFPESRTLSNACAGAA